MSENFGDKLLIELNLFRFCLPIQHVIFSFQYRLLSNLMWYIQLVKCVFYLFCKPKMVVISDYFIKSKLMQMYKIQYISRAWYIKENWEHLSMKYGTILGFFFFSKSTISKGFPYFANIWSFSDSAKNGFDPIFNLITGSAQTTNRPHTNTCDPNQDTLFFSFLKRYCTSYPKIRMLCSISKLSSFWKIICASCSKLSEELKKSIKI